MFRHLSQTKVDELLALFDRHVGELSASAHGSDFDASYYTKHRDRFLAILERLPVFSPCETALELGATDFFQVALGQALDCKTTIGTIFSSRVEDKYYKRPVSIGAHHVQNLTLSVDLESDILPLGASSVDFVLCSEVIEHLDIDPMFMLGEINRVLRMDGYMMVTTPNACSARNFWKIAHGYRPHFFMQYERSRSPYRHNIEYDTHAIRQMAEAAGFEVEQLETKDVFEPSLNESLDFLRRAHLPLEDRGDCIFLVARKKSPVIDRWPTGIYV